MKFGISNLAWEIDKNQEIFDLLNLLNIKYIEVAPSKICSWDDDNFFDSLKRYKNIVEQNGLKICGLQSIFFNKNISVFDDNKNFIEHFKKVIDVSDILGADYIVYGSPKTRKINKKEEEEIFIDTFLNISDIATKTNICIESNPKEYGCNFIVNMDECIEIIEKINKPNIKSHIDLSSAILNKENVKNYDLNLNRTAHISNPYLKEITEEYKDFYKDLFGLDLDYITLEVVNCNEIKSIERQINLINDYK